MSEETEAFSATVRRIAEESPDATLYAVVDAAQVEFAPVLLDGYGARFSSLFSGDGADDLRDVAPYLVEIDPLSDAFEWISSDVAPIGACIFFTSSHGFEAVRLHLKKFLRIEGPEETMWFFRFYTAKVFAAHYEAFNDDQRAQFFLKLDTLFAWHGGWDHIKVFGQQGAENRTLEALHAEV